MFIRPFGAITIAAALSLTACGVPEDAATGAPPIAQASASAPPTMTPLGTVTPPQSTPTLVPTNDPTATATATTAPSATPTTDATATASATAAAASPTAIDDGDHSDDGHPIAVEIANEFGVPVDEVEAYHNDGIGYGVLAQFYGIAYGRCGAAGSYTVEQLIALKQGGMGMGEIRKQTLGSAAADECSLGRLKQGDLDAADAAQADKPKPDHQLRPKPEQKPKPGNNGGGNGGANGGGNGKGK